MPSRGAMDLSEADKVGTTKERGQVTKLFTATALVDETKLERSK